MSTLQEFTNPTGYWSYEGPYQLHVTNRVNLDYLRHYHDVRVEGTLVSVGERGLLRSTLQQTPHYPMCMSAGEQELHFFLHKDIIRICRPNGQLLWQNPSLTGVLMQELDKRPSGSWPMFYYDGERIIGQIGRFGGWYQLDVGQEVSFDRHGTFRFTKTFKTLAYLDVTLPRKGWNPTPATYRIRIPTGKSLIIFRSNYYMEWMGKTWCYKDFGYRPGYQPLRETEVNKIFEMLEPGLLWEETVRQGIIRSNPKDVRNLIDDLRDAHIAPTLFREKVEKATKDFFDRGN